MATTTSFTSFFERWLLQQQTLLDDLLSLLHSPPQDDAVKAETRDRLFEQVISHYNRYYEEKSSAANRNPFPFFSPPWLTPFERTLLWVSGFKPSIIFRLIGEAVGEELTAEQRRRMEEEWAETRRREREVAKEMARVQESVAGPPIYALMREDRRLIDGEVDELGEAMEVLTAAMRRVMEEADAVRGSTVRSVLEILSPAQRIKFLAAAAQYTLQVRRCGLHRNPSI